MVDTLFSWSPANASQFQRISIEALLGPLNDIEQKHAPRWLWIAGKQEIVQAGPRAAIVGTREPSEQGARVAASVTKALVAADVTIVSGLAKGIDTIAHQTAIENGGRTIAILGTPLDRSYPSQNRALQEQIMKEHLAISQFPSSHPIEKRNFPLRNRTMALLSHATVIIEAGDTSGTLHQGREALRLGRPLFIHARILKSTSLRWPSQMQRYGASVFSEPEDILQALPASAGAIHAF